MRRVVLLAALLVLAWTSVAAAEVRSLAQFWAENTGLQTGVLDDDGNDWVEWPESWKLLWIYGFLAGTYRISVYLQEVPLPVWPEMAQKVPEQVFESMRDALAALALVRLGSDYPFRVGAYKLELDALYRDEANRSIRLTDAMHIANEHLSRRYVDIAKWRRTKGE